MAFEVAASGQNVGDSRRGVRQTPGVQGGRACLRDTRHTVAGLVHWRRLGLADQEILLRHPDLSQTDLDNAWTYCDRNGEEIDRAIHADEEA